MSPKAIIRPFVELDNIDKAREIFRLSRLGLVTKQIAKACGVTESAICAIARREGLVVSTSLRDERVRREDPVSRHSYRDVWSLPEHDRARRIHQRLTKAAGAMLKESGTALLPRPETPPARPVVPLVPVHSVQRSAPFNFLTTPSARNIIALVALKSGLRVDDITGPRRGRELVAARHHAIRLINSHCPHLSLPAIGRIFNRDHTSILFALGRTKRNPKVNPEASVSPQVTDTHTFRACNAGNPSNSGQISA